MKRVILLALFAVVLGGRSFAIVHMTNAPAVSVSPNADLQSLPTELSNMPFDQLMNLTPSEYKKMTGHRLGFKNSIALKAAQKAMKNTTTTSGGGAAISKGLYIVLAIIGLGFIGIGVNSSWEGSAWIIGLILSLLFWLPGFIYSLIKMKDYY